jgi:hypothetical protein
MVVKFEFKQSNFAEVAVNNEIFENMLNLNTDYPLVTNLLSPIYNKHLY